MHCRLAVIASHFVQYQAPVWRALARRSEIDLRVYYLSDHGRRPGLDREFGERFQWDVALDEGYSWELLPGAAGATPRSRRKRWSVEPTRLVFRDVGDVYLRSDYDSPGAVLFFYACLAKQRPVLYRGETTLQSENVRRGRLKRALLRPVFRRDVHALAIGQRAAAYARSLGVPTDRIAPSPYSVDDGYWASAARALAPKHRDLRRAYGLPKDLPVVLFCGKLTENKRALDLAHALCRLSAKRPISLLVVGTGEQLERLKQVVTGCPALVARFPGFINQSRLPEAYAVADVISLPSASETWGLVINEAMHSGCVPVVSERVGCGPDLVEGVGETHPVGDVGALCACLGRVLDELPERKARVPGRIGGHSLARAVDSIAEAALRAAGERNENR
jgi:glycosyltransferase involved in cell wall biosynthesis